MVDDVLTPEECDALKRENARLRRQVQQLRMESLSSTAGFEHLLTDSDAWVWRIDTAGRYTFTSDLVEEILGYTPVEVIGRPFYSFFHPDDRDELRELAMAAITAGRPFLSFRNRNVRKDGATVILETTGFPIISPDGTVIGYYGGDRDVTALVQAEQARREGEDMFHHIFDELGDAVYVTLLDDDRSRKVVEVNKEALRRVGGRKDAVIGKDLLTDFTLQHLEPSLETILTTLERGETARYVVHRVDVDGNDRWEDVVDVPITHRGRRASLSVSRDITKQRRAQEELRLGREQWRALYKGSPIATMTWQRVDGDFQFIDFNDAIDEMTGGKIASYLGKRTSEMYPDQPEILEGISECYRTHRSMQGEIEHRFVTTGDVRTLWVTTGFAPPDLILVHLMDISARKRMERELRAANNDLQRILDVMGEGVVVLDDKGRMTRLNKKACELFGREESEILGNDYSFWTHPDSCELLASEQRKRRRGERSAYEARMLRDDGTPFWAQIIAAPVIGEDGEFHGSVGCLRDVTREKAALAELKRLHAFNDQLIKTAGVWINVTDKEGNIVLWNDEAEQISGYSREEVVGNDSIWKLLYPDPEYRAKIWRSQKNVGLDGDETETIETIIRTKDGGEKVILWSGRPRYDDLGQLDGWVNVGHDVTQTKHNLQRLQDYAAQVERLSREKTRFLSVASHELRTPLTIIRGFIDLMSEQEPRLDQRDKIKRIQMQLDRFTDLLDNLLSVSRIDAGESSFSPTVVDLEEIVRKAIGLLTPQAVEKGVMIEFSDKHSPVSAYVDAQGVMQVITNILLNSINYTPSGGKIIVSVSNSPGKGKIVVSDTGIGICEGEQELIFNEFHRTDRARRMKANGNGLGLAIVKRLLSEMNGEIWIRSAGKNKGSTVSITLPVSAPAEEKVKKTDANTDL